MSSAALSAGLSTALFARLPIMQYVAQSIEENSRNLPALLKIIEDLISNIREQIIINYISENYQKNIGLLTELRELIITSMIPIFEHYMFNSTIDETKILGYIDLCIIYWDIILLKPLDGTEKTKLITEFLDDSHTSDLIKIFCDVRKDKVINSAASYCEESTDLLKLLLKMHLFPRLIPVEINYSLDEDGNINGIITTQESIFPHKINLELPRTFNPIQLDNELREITFRIERIYGNILGISFSHQVNSQDFNMCPELVKIFNSSSA